MNGGKIFFPSKKYDCKVHFYTNFSVVFFNRVVEDKPFPLFMSYRAPHYFEGPIRDFVYTLTGVGQNLKKSMEQKSIFLTSK